MVSYFWYEDRWRHAFLRHVIHICSSPLPHYWKPWIDTDFQLQCFWIKLGAIQNYHHAPYRKKKIWYYTLSTLWVSFSCRSMQFINLVPFNIFCLKVDMFKHTGSVCLQILNISVCIKTSNLISRWAYNYKDIQCVTLIERLVRTEPLERLYRYPTSDLLARVYVW